MEPWGLSGPEFLFIYIGAMIAAIWLSQALRNHWWTAPEREQGRLSEDEVAYLCGGPRRLQEVAIARMVERGALRVQRDGDLTPTGAPAQTPLEQDLLQLLEQRPRSAAQLATSGHWTVNATEESLYNRGLLHRETPRQKFLITLPVLVVFLVGVARLINGISLGRPVVFLLILVVVSLVILLGRPNASTRWRSRAGDKLHEDIAAEKAGDRITPLVGAAGLVAVGGFGLFPDPTIATALVPPVAETTSSNDGGGCGSGCGGGGCGGCGGCGG
ncbi:TIGR04222 domain-containing membrane protein [Actinocrispum sp. NPDC049592]|uniref:TIGR04222 domain-containing membrane protein n=1 Tax=Actinocrispum sp. NPDC049592 TaxID=3154835 RepID=UPI00343A8A8F